MGADASATWSGELIQSAIDGCPDNQVVVLPAGTYLLKSPIGIKRPIVLRGAGAPATKIVESASINLSATPGTWPGQNTLHAVDWTGGYEKGTTTITVADASGIHVGQPLVLDQPNAHEQTAMIWWAACHENGRESVDYAKLTSILIEATKELQQQNATLSVRNHAIESRLGKLEATILEFGGPRTETLPRVVHKR